MNGLIDTVSYDQYNDIPSIDDLGAKSRVIFSAETYKKFMEMLVSSHKRNVETGCFFVGRQSEGDPFSIYIDCCTSEFLCEDAFFDGGSANPTQQNYNELEAFIKKYNKEGKRPCVFHFHTHPTKGYYESFSDQDLHLYAKMAYDNPNCDTFGILSFPMQKAMGVSIVLPNEPGCINDNYSANFYRYPNIYYCSGNEVYRMGTFDKQYKNRKYKSRETHRSSSIVRNVTCSDGVKKVCAIGRNPNNNLSIEDSVVGYIDINHNICIPNENVQLCFENKELER